MYCLEHVLHEKRYTKLWEQQFKLSDLIQYSLWVLKDLDVSVVTTCLHISHLVPPHHLPELFSFSRGSTFALTRISFKLLALLNPARGILSKTFQCSLLGVNSKCISESRFLSFERTGWEVILKTNLLLFPTLFRLLDTSDLTPTCHCNLFLSARPLIHYIVYQNKTEQILLKCKAWLKGIDFLQWQT